MSFVERQLELSNGSHVVIRFFEPVADQADFRCDYEITGLDATRKSHGFGVDAVQALVLAMQKAHIDLLASRQAKAGELTWLGQPDLGLPLPANVKPADFT